MRSHLYVGQSKLHSSCPRESLYSIIRVRKTEIYLTDSHCVKILTPLVKSSVSEREISNTGYSSAAYKTSEETRRESFLRRIALMGMKYTAEPGLLDSPTELNVVSSYFNKLHSLQK